MEDPMDGSEFITVKQAAKIAGKSYLAVRHWMLAGAYGVPPLACMRVGHVQLIKRVDLERFMEAVAGHEDGRTTRHREAKAGAN